MNNKQQTDMKIAILDARTVNPGDLSWESIQNLGECAIYEETAAADTVAHCTGAEAVLTNKVCLRKAELDALPQLKYIGVLATGYNVIDIDEARRRGIVVTNIPAYSTDSVVQMVFAHLLNITNQTAHYTAEIKEGAWCNSRDFTYWNTPLVELAGKTFGIVGLGHIGSAVARVANAFGMRVIALTSKRREALEPYITPVSREELFRESDVLSLHCPLTDSTLHFVNAETLAWMKPSAILINTGRGPLLDEQAVADALNGGRLFAAGVDVLSTEPPMPDNPLLTARRCYLTPHIAWATREARTRLMAIATENIRAFQSGKTINNVAG